MKEFFIRVRLEPDEPLSDAKVREICLEMVEILEAWADQHIGYCKIDSNYSLDK